MSHFYMTLAPGKTPLFSKDATCSYSWKASYQQNSRKYQTSSWLHVGVATTNGFNYEFYLSSDQWSILF